MKPLNLQSLSTAALLKIAGRGPADSDYEQAIQKELEGRGELSRRPDRGTLSLFTAAEMADGRSKMAAPTPISQLPSSVPARRYPGL